MPDATTPLEPWTVEASRLVYDDPPWVRVHAERVRLPDGRTVEPYYRLDHPPYVSVFARTAEGNVVVERHYRHGPRRVCLTLPAGHLEEGEDPLACAQRELLEETGYEAPTWRSLGSYTLSGNRGGGTAYLFAAEGARRVADPQSDDLEETQVLTMPVGEVLERLARGEFPILSSAATIGLGLQVDALGK